MVAEDGTQLGVMPTRDALALAREQELDLVEVAPNSVPPVCRLLDYGKFRYLQSTKEREMRKGQKAHGMREVRFRPKIGQHDIDFKARLVKRLLGEGNKVKVSVMFRGREIAHPEIAVALLRRVHDGLKEESKLEQAPNLEGRFMSIILTPAKAAAKPAAPADETLAEAALVEAAAARPAVATAERAEPEAAAAEPAAAVAEKAEPEAAVAQAAPVAEQAGPEATAEPAAAVAEKAEPEAAVAQAAPVAEQAEPEAAVAQAAAVAEQAEPAAATKPAKAAVKKSAPAAAAKPAKAAVKTAAATKPAKGVAKKAAAAKPAKATAKKA